MAREIAPLNPSGSALAAGREVEARRRELLSLRHSFVLETTLASHSLLQFVGMAKRGGYRTTLLYLYISHPALCLERVAMRVARGGHHIPSVAVQRRYALGLDLLPRYLRAVHDAEVFLADGVPKLVLRKAGRETDVVEPAIWSEISNRMKGPGD